MEPFFADYSERLTALHESIVAEIAGLPSEALDWTPGAEMNSLTVLVTHTAGSERYWIGDVAGQRPSGRVRADEFVASGRTADQLRALLDLTLAQCNEVLAELRLSDLEALRDTPDGRTFSVEWALLHALEHTGQHTGHVQLTSQLWREIT